MAPSAMFLTAMAFAPNIHINLASQIRFPAGERPHHSRSYYQDANDTGLKFPVHHQLSEQVRLQHNQQKHRSAASSDLLYDNRHAEINKQMERVEDISEDGSLLWSPVSLEQQSDGAGRNLCVDGKQLPDFYVLGVQKCATSSLAADLMGAGMTNVHGDMNDKEFHFFDHRMDAHIEGLDGLKKNREIWLRWMPDCPYSEENKLAKRQVLADFTPDYLRIVPRPDELVPIGDWMAVQEARLNAPQKMRMLYGKVMSDKLNFAMMIREPLGQMQSAWYHAQSFDFNNACKSCRADSFHDALSNLVEGMKRSPQEYTAWLWTTMYARQLKYWLAQFPASQFFVIPTGEYSRGDRDSICRGFSERLGFRMDCESQGQDASHSWSHEHPPVSEDASPELRAEFDELMAQEKNNLVQLLTQSHSEGMSLANYGGAVGDQDAVRAWLENSW